jgi:hypothetical protein
MSNPPSGDLRLIFQPGKVASQSIEAALRQADPASIVERHHFLSDEVLAEFERIGAAEPAGSEVAVSVGEQLQAAQNCRRVIADRQRRVLVVTGFRDPLDFAISAFFQNIAFFCPQLTYEAGRLEQETAAAIDIFHDEFERFIWRRSNRIRSSGLRELMVDLKFHNISNWFRTEFQDYLGIDIFNYNVGSNSFIEFSRGRFEFLVYRFEALTDCIDRISNKLNRPDAIVIPRRNVAAEKDHGLVYGAFRRQFEPCEAMVKYYYRSRYFEHFYGPFDPAF